MLTSTSISLLSKNEWDADGAGNPGLGWWVAWQLALSCPSTLLESPPAPSPLVLNLQGLELRVAGDGSVSHTPLSPEEDLKLYTGVGMWEQGRSRNPILALMSRHILQSNFRANSILNSLLLLVSASVSKNAQWGSNRVPSSLHLPTAMENGHLAEPAHASFLFLRRQSDNSFPVLPFPEPSHQNAQSQ